MKVRIAVVMNDKGHWNACGYYQWTDKEAVETAECGLDELGHEQVSFVEADIPVPVSPTIVGEVKPM